MDKTAEVTTSVFYENWKVTGESPVRNEFPRRGVFFYPKTVVAMDVYHGYKRWKQQFLWRKKR